MTHDAVLLRAGQHSCDMDHYHAREVELIPGGRHRALPHIQHDNRYPLSGCTIDSASSSKAR
ncbi:MAG: hypothetical protein AABZ58_03250, partial [Chloroflexota bacterium]